MSQRIWNLPGGAYLQRWWWLALAVVALVMAGIVSTMVLSNSTAAVGSTDSLFAVERGPLTIGVSSSGNIRSSQAEIIKNEVEGRTTILSLIEEGTRVQKGDLLIELDDSELKDQRIDQEIRVETEKANLVTAQENLQIAKKQGQADIEAAQVELQLAILDLEKYTGISVWDVITLTNHPGSTGQTNLMDVADELSKVDWSQVDLAVSVQNDEGEYAQELQKAENAITLAKSELERAEDRLSGSETLQEKGYITENELEADRLEYKRKKLALEVARSEKALLEAFTRKRKLAELLSAVDQKAFALEKARHQATATETDSKSKLAAQKAAFQREKEKLDKINDQIKKCTIYAPVDGMVVYGTTGQDRWDDEEPLDEGVEVRERQELFRLPTADQMVADIKIHESMLQKVNTGLPVVVTTDALPDRQFVGRVQKIAVMPDSQSRWLNPDLKVYNTEVLIEGETGGLRPGMSCNAEIIVERFDDTLYVPVQSVLTVKGESTVYVPGSKGRPEARPVKVGLDNNRMIQVVSGLNEGEMVMLDPPLPPAAKGQTQVAQLGGQGGPDGQGQGEQGGDEPGGGNRRARADFNSGGGGGPGPGGGGGPGGEGLGRGGRGENGSPGGNRPDEEPSQNDPRQMAQRFQNMSEEERNKFINSDEGKKMLQQWRSNREGNPQPSGKPATGEAENDT